MTELKQKLETKGEGPEPTTLASTVPADLLGFLVPRPSVFV
jgi:hypothetical protein